MGMGSYAAAGVYGPDFGFGIVGAVKELSVYSTNMINKPKNESAMVITNAVSESEEVINVPTE